jgi:hypothetical protein
VRKFSVFRLDPPPELVEAYRRVVTIHIIEAVRWVDDYTLLAQGDFGQSVLALS